MIIIEKSDAIGWFDTGFQTSAPGQAGCNIQIGNLASDWNDGGLSKGRVSLIVSDKCPYFLINASVGFSPSSNHNSTE